MLKKVLLTIFVLFYFSPLFATFERINSLKELDKEFEKSDDHTLIVFDIDDVLIITEDQAFHKNADQILMPIVNEAIQQSKTPEAKKELETIHSLAITLPHHTLIEKETPSLIHQLQQKKVKVIALTAMYSGPLGVVSKMERWRVDQLKSFDIDFSSAFSDLKHISMIEIAKANQRAPLFEDGILFSRGYTKGEVLKAFLKYSGFMPTKIVFVDDMVENLDSVRKEIESLNQNIDFKGFEYIGAERLYRKLDPDVIQFQFNYLIQNKKWLSDLEVKKLMTSSENNKK